MPMVKLPLTVEHGLLGFVRQQPLHGYEIAQRLAATAELGLAWYWKQSQVYAELGRLEEEGYLTSVVEAQGLRPPRKVFQLTAQGAAAFADWITSPVAHGRDFQLEFPLKLYFAQLEGGATAQTLLARQQEVCRSWLEALHAQEQPAGDDNPTYARLVQEFRRSQIATTLGWLNTCAAQLVESQGEGEPSP
jgi:PadR family transcriptional regulator, regulatory protein AphA